MKRPSMFKALDSTLASVNFLVQPPLLITMIKTSMNGAWQPIFTDMHEIIVLHTVHRARCIILLIRSKESIITRYFLLTPFQLAMIEKTIPGTRAR